MKKQYKIHQLYTQTHWPSFFKDWNFDTEFTKIASLQGCDVVRASWLTEFEESKRTKASEAMQLLKEANRMIDLLDRDYTIYIDSAEVAIKIENNILYADDTQINLDFLLKNKTHSTTPPLNEESLIKEIKSNRNITLFVSTTDSEMDLLFENNPYKQKQVKTLTHRFTEAAAIHLQQEKNQGHDFIISHFDMTENTSIFLEWVKSKISFSNLGIATTQNNRLTPEATIIGFMLPKHLLIQQK